MQNVHQHSTYNARLGGEGDNAVLWGEGGEKDMMGRGGRASYTASLPPQLFWHAIEC